MTLKAEDFDKLRKQAKELLEPEVGNGHKAISLTRHLFLDIINDMEKIQGMITETKIDLTKHDDSGRVLDPESYEDAKREALERHMEEMTILEGNKPTLCDTPKETYGKFLILYKAVCHSIR
jgi:hypothetical protein